MASTKILNTKKETVKEIVENIKNSDAVVVFSYQGLTVADLSNLRRELRKVGGDVKIYKNTLSKIAFHELNLNLDEFSEGPNAIMFGKDLIESIKVLSKFAKGNKVVEIRTGIIDGSVVTVDTINEYASIPSYEGLLTMFAAGLMEHVKSFAIGLDLIAKQKEN